jgi:cytochrome P450 / NADPH-cytochrome P450 reductase
MGRNTVVIASQRLSAKVSDEKRFHKIVSDSLEELRHGLHDGLFTAQTGEKNWELAHRILVPAFGPLNIAAMFDEMKDVRLQSHPFPAETEY